ncbi:hypothetical protein ACUY4Q_003063 [Phytobacter sp. AG2a]
MTSSGGEGDATVLLQFFRESAACGFLQFCRGGFYFDQGCEAARKIHRLDTGGVSLGGGQVVAIPAVPGAGDPLRAAVTGRFLDHFAGATAQRVVQVAGAGQGAVLLAAGVVHQPVLVVVVIPVAVAAAVADKALIPSGQPAVAVMVVKIFRIPADTVVRPDRGQGGVRDPVSQTVTGRVGGVMP